MCRRNRAAGLVGGHRYVTYTGFPNRGFQDPYYDHLRWSRGTAELLLGDRARRFAPPYGTMLVAKGAEKCREYLRRRGNAQHVNEKSAEQGGFAMAVTDALSVTLPRIRPSHTIAPRGHRQHGRHHHRVVRFSPLQRRHRLRLRKTVLSQIRSAGRRARSLRRLHRGLHRAADRRGDFRSLRRPHRPQGNADRDLADHRPRHFRGGLRAHL